MRNLPLILTAFFLVACSGAASHVEAPRSGPWDLKHQESTIQYMTIKNADIAEVNSFGLFSGEVTDSGDVQIDIALNSVQTNIDTRDERMKKYVFKTDDYPSAVITTSLSLAELDILETGARTTIENEISVSLAGQSASYDAAFTITRLGANKALVESAAPIIVSAADFNVMDGIETLRGLAKLDSITPVVPVTFSLVFRR